MAAFAPFPSLKIPLSYSLSPSLSLLLLKALVSPLTLAGITSFQSWGFGETKARCLGFGLLTQTSPEAGAQRAGQLRDKNTN